MEFMATMGIFAAVSLGTWVLLLPTRSRRRLEAVQAWGLEEKPGEISFKQRVLWPALSGFTQRMAGLAPKSLKEKVKVELQMAGNPAGLGATEFMGIWWGAGLLPLFLLPILGTNALTISAIGWLFPRLWLTRKVRSRQEAIVKSLPDLMDLLTVSVEAGLGFDGALARVCEKLTGPLQEESLRMLQQMRMGRPRKDALADLSARTGVPDVASLVTALIQADQLGVGIGRVLRIQSDQMRITRRQRAEEAAMKAPVKMLFPMVFFIFPVLFVVLLGPALIQIIQTFQ